MSLYTFSFQRCITYPYSVDKPFWYLPARHLDVTLEQKQYTMVNHIHIDPYNTTVSNIKKRDRP